jgi:glycosyltransferase involved in cell wall biosynthesis
MPPKVTIGLPFRNAENTLWAAIQSVFCQTSSDWELILADDGSVDGSYEVAERARDPRVKLVRDGENRGLSYRLNQIAALASAPHLARMDADDVMHPERIAIQMERLERSPELSVLGSAAYVIDGRNRVVGVRGVREPDFRPASVLRGSPLIHPTVIGRTAWFRENPYDGRFVRAEDHELWCRVCDTGRLGRADEPLLFYRDIPSIAKTLAGYKTERMIFRVHGPRKIGITGAVAETCKSYVKTAVVASSGILRVTGPIWAHRNRRLPEDARRSAEAVLERVLRTDVPVRAGVQR